MRFTVQRAAARPALPADRIYRLDGTQHEMRHRPLRPLPIRPDLHLQGRPGLCASTGLRSIFCRAGDLTWQTASKPKLAVWKFASCDGCQLSLLDCEDELLDRRRRGRDRQFPRSVARRREAGPYDLSLVEGSITTAHDAERIQEVRRQSKHPGHHRRLRHGRRHSGAAQFRRRERLHRRRLCRARIHRHARDLDADLRPRAGRFRAARLPDQQASAHRGDQRVPRRPQAGNRRAQRLHRMQAARHGLRDGGQGTPCLGPVTHAGCGAICPSFRPRLLRLLWPDGNAQHRGPGAQWLAASACTPRDIARVFRTFNAMAEPFRKESDGAMATKTISVDYLARVEGEGALDLEISDGRLVPAELDDFRAAALFRGVAARARLHRSPRHRRPHLRHLPDRLSDERRACDRKRASASRSTDSCARCGGCIYCGEWIESHALHVVHAACAGFSRLSQTRSQMARDHGDVVRSAACPEENGQRIAAPCSAGAKSIRSMSGSAAFIGYRSDRELEALAEQLKRARDAAIELVRWVATFPFPRFRTGLRVRRAAPSRRISV